MSANRRKSSEYSGSYDSSQSGMISMKQKLSKEEKRKARLHLYKICFKDWMAIVGILPALASGVMPVLFVFFSTPMINALQDWGTSKSLQPMLPGVFEKINQDPQAGALCGDYAKFNANPQMCKEVLKKGGLSDQEADWITKAIQNNGQVYNPMPKIVTCTKKMTAIAAAFAFCMFWDVFLWTLVGTRVQNKMKIAMFTNLMKSEIAFFDVTPIGNILTLLSEDAESIEMAFGTVKATQFQSVTQGILGLIFAFTRKWQVAFVSICFIPIVAICLLCIIPSILKNSALKFKHVSKSMTIAEETLSAVRTVRGFCREEAETKRFVRSTKDGARHDRNIGLLIALFLFVVLVSVIADLLADFYYGATFVNKNELSFGDLGTLFTYTLLGSFGVVSIQGTMQGEEKCIAAGARILAVAEHVPTIPFDGGEQIEDFKGEIEFRNVSFKYPTRDAYVLKNVSFVIHKDQSGALVGHSGSGKSTCVQLLERFYDANEGLVLLDGHDIKTLDPHWLHQKIALVGQEPVLFRNSLRENIKYGAHDATDEEVLAAIEIANAKKILTKLENGLDTLVGDKGSTLSGGQRQRFAIARAVIKKPTILICDEATSALDSESEKKVQIALDKVTQNCTSVTVAHRLSTIRNCDIIYVFDAGEIKESGNHNELVKKGGFYYNLVFRQLTDKDTKEHDEAAKAKQNSKNDSDDDDNSGNDNDNPSDVATDSED